MALQIWLPLTGDLHNQGLTQITVTVSGTTSFNTAGKIGQSLTCNGSSFWTITPVTLGNAATIACWTKTSAGGKMPWVITASSSDRLNLYESGQYTLNTGDGNNNPFKDINGNTISVLTDNAWHHFVVTFDGTVSKLYIDGVYRGTATTYRNPTTTSAKIVRLAGGYGGGHSYDWNGSINDFRIYDHALSPKEVEEIAKGLVLHYQLNTNRNLNLIKNGFGELGSTNWDSSTRIYSDVPADQPEIKASFLNNTTLEFIPVYPNTQYKISLYIKASTTSGNTYPSIIPYDIDKKQINYFNTRIGFNLNTMTTLSRALNPGDTKIYVASLSAWNDSSGHYYNYAALFNYQDSFGYTYPEGVYTQNTPSFGSSTNAKTNLDKTNNIITLNSAYSGPALPIGTKVCASSAGSTYFYPLGSIPNSSISNWTYKEGTFSTTNAYLLAARYFKYYASSTSYQAGIKLINMTSLDSSNIIQDSSGYSHNGIVVGTLTAVAGSPRYEVATQFTATNYIKNTDFIYNDSAWSISLWYFFTSAPSGYQSLICLSKGNGSDANKKMAIIPNTSYIWFKCESNNRQLSSVKVNEWTHLVLTSVGKVYENGVEKLSITPGTILTDCDDLVIGARASAANAASVTIPLTGKISDIRIYATALTAAQVKELYNTSMSVDSNGNIYARELVEL